MNAAPLLGWKVIREVFQGEGERLIADWLYGSRYSPLFGERPVTHGLEGFSSVCLVADLNARDDEEEEAGDSPLSCVRC